MRVGPSTVNRALPPSRTAHYKVHHGFYIFHIVTISRIDHPQILLNLCSMAFGGRNLTKSKIYVMTDRVRNGLLCMIETFATKQELAGKTRNSFGKRANAFNGSFSGSSRASNSTGVCGYVSEGIVCCRVLLFCCRAIFTSCANFLSVLSTEVISSCFVFVVLCVHCAHRLALCALCACLYVYVFSS